MNSQTSLVASQVRLRQWALMIQECNNRPEGMMISTWCKQNNISKAKYYYRLQRVREACLDNTDMLDTPAQTFVELPVKKNPLVAEPLLTTAKSITSDATITFPNGIKLELSHHVDTDLIKALFLADAYAE